MDPVLAAIKESDARIWRFLMPAQGNLTIGLASAGTTRPLDLQLIGDIFARVERLAGVSAPQIVFLDLHSEQEAPDLDLLVLAGDLDMDSTKLRVLPRLIDKANAVFVIGAAVRWFARSSWSRGLRLAMHWSDGIRLQAMGHDAILSSAILEVEGKWTTCCGNAATLDLGMSFVRDLFGSRIAASVQEELCLQVVREPGERQIQPLQPQFHELVPKLAEAIALMKANIEEPLMTEDIASLVGLSRRQLERLFKKHLDAIPSRYYLELRLNRARLLLGEARHSLLEIGLMCGFSSGSHFSSSYGAVFGTTPRAERQRALRCATPI